MGQKTKLKLAERALKETHTKYQTLFESASDAILLKNSNHVFVACNSRGLEMYGCSMDQIIGKTYADFSPERQSDGTLSWDKGQEILKLATAGTPQYFEWEARKFNGLVFCSEVSLNRMDLPDGIFFLVIVRDCTRRKGTEEALLKALSEIEKLKERIHADYTYLREEIKQGHNYEEMVGQSPALKYVLQKISQIAPIDTTTLILGETGVGKELVARAIHNASTRKDRPLVKVNCTTLPATLVESELFGHERGAFTGAFSRQIGRFELANGATIFLDEIGELPLELQPKLLRVLQDGEFDRLGNMRPIRTDVRIIAATNRNLEEEVRLGRFREDLWYRLNVFPITIPPLRQRREDIPLLADRFAQQFAVKLRKSFYPISDSVLNSLMEYSWPGNIRELKNVIERAVIVSEPPVLSVELPTVPNIKTGSKQTLEDMERRHILQILEDVRWKIDGNNGAAQILGLNASTLRSRMKKLRIQKENQ